ncbi:MAG: tetratricopeptide repeat protein [Verrucomicrobia bacterium]|nr:tetratricopeptide repeat protein [Verrucomicrobiota bacterium]
MKKFGGNPQDIYLAPPEVEEEPEYKLKMPPELEARLRRHHIQFSLSALLFIGLTVALVSLLTREIRVKPAAVQIAAPHAESQNVSLYSLPEEEEWVLMYGASVNNAAAEKEGDRSLSTKWIKNAAYHWIVGNQALSRKNYGAAADHLEEALQIFPDMKGVNEALGTAYLKQHLFEKAIEPLKKALMEKASFPAISNLGVALMAAGRLDEAEGYLLQALALYPDHPGCHKNLALLYQKMELPEKALRHLETTLSLYEPDLEIVELYAGYLISFGETERATAFLRKVCAQQQDEEALPFYLLLAKTEASATNVVPAINALKSIARYLSPNLMLIELHREEFDTIRDTESFQTLLHQLEIAMVTLENQN